MRIRIIADPGTSTGYHIDCRRGLRRACVQVARGVAQFGCQRGRLTSIEDSILLQSVDDTDDVMSGGAGESTVRAIAALLDPPVEVLASVPVT